MDYEANNRVSKKNNIIINKCNQCDDAAHNKFVIIDS